MLVLDEYVVKTKLFESLTCYYLIGNTIYCEYCKGAGRSQKVQKGTIDLSVDSHSFQPLSGEWPKPIEGRLSPITMREGMKLMGYTQKQRVSDKLLGKEAFGINQYTFYQEMFNRLLKRLAEESGEEEIFVMQSMQIGEDIQMLEARVDRQLSVIRDMALQPIKSRESFTLNAQDRALICNLIEISCGKNKLHQSFSDLGLDLKLISDPDNVTGALRFEGGITLEEAFLRRKQG